MPRRMRERLRRLQLDVRPGEQSGIRIIHLAVAAAIQLLLCRRQPDQRLQPRQQLVGADRLADEVRDAQRACTLAGSFLLIAGNHDHRNVTNPRQPRVANPRQQTIAIQHRHCRVGDHRPYRVIEHDRLPPGFAVGLFAVIEVATQMLDDHRPHQARIIDHQHARQLPQFTAHDDLRFTRDRPFNLNQTPPTSTTTLPRARPARYSGKRLGNSSKATLRAMAARCGGFMSDASRCQMPLR